MDRAPPTILVTDLLKEVTDEHLEIYFEKVSGGGDLDQVTLFRGQRCAFITFQEESSE